MAAVIHRLRDERVRIGLVHLDTIARRNPGGGYWLDQHPPRRRRFVALRWLGTAALYALGFAGIAGAGFAAWGLMQ